MSDDGREATTVAFQRWLSYGTGLALILLVGAAGPLLLTWRTPPEMAVPVAVTSPTDALVVDLKDDATGQDVARLEAATGLDLQENSIESHAARLMRADHVDPDRESATLAALRADPAVEAAEPEQLYRLI